LRYKEVVIPHILLRCAIKTTLFATNVRGGQLALDTVGMTRFDVTAATVLDALCDQVRTGVLAHLWGVFPETCWIGRFAVNN